MGRKIVLLSDGTGHGAHKLFRTNVWRVYRALDLSGPDQIALYDDGVGTSKFKPLALLGGGFGWGLKRNVLDLYSFLCQNYNEGDDIYLFGFSRGAFTVRVLIAFLLSEGLVSDFYSQDDLYRKAKHLYRRFREQRKTRFRIEVLGRWIRNRALKAWHSDASANPKTIPVKRIKFVGVWDTVDAYGLPVRELKVGIDNYLWPLALEDRQLDPRIEKACHALAIDDKRQTFHPLLWDESDTALLPPANHTDDERLTQVWFAGAHSNVGGGYPDDSLSQVPLDWMIREAEKKGVLFAPGTVPQIASSGSPFGRLYNSRAGLGAYYRYDPRHLDPATDSQGAVVPLPKIHSSVLSRMMFGSDSYAPLNLPSRIRIVAEQNDQGATKNIFEFDEYRTLIEAATHKTDILSLPHEGALQLIWDTVWWRRIVSFATLCLTVYLTVLPFHPALEFDLWTFVHAPFAAISDASLVVAPVTTNFSILFERPLAIIANVAEMILPGSETPWIKAASMKPSLYLPWLVLLIACFKLGAFIDRRIQDRALAAWNPKWRYIRFLWSREAARSRALTAIAASILLIVCISMFLWLAQRVGQACNLQLDCLWQDTELVLRSGFPFGLDIVFRIYLVILLAASGVLGMWLYFQIIRRSHRVQDEEIQGFLLWLARSVRRRRSFQRSYEILGAHVLPCLLAAAVVFLLVCGANQISLLAIEASGLPCNRSHVASTSVVSGQNETIVIRQPLNSFCGLVTLPLEPGATYEIMANYFNVFADRSKQVGLLNFIPEKYVPLPLRGLPEPRLVRPFLRRIDQPQHIMIASTTMGGGEVVLANKTTDIVTGKDGSLYLYANEPVIALPFLYDLYYRDIQGVAEFTLKPKPSAQDASVKSTGSH